MQPRLRRERMMGIARVHVHVAAVGGALVALMGCQSGDLGTVQRQRDSLAVELKSAHARIDALEHGPDRLMAAAKRLEAARQYGAAADSAKRLIEQFPTADEALGADSLRARVLAIEAKLEAAARDSLAKEEARAAARRARAVASLIRKRDDVQGSTEYYPRFAGQYVNGRSALFLKLHVPDGQAPSIAFGIRFVADSWLFIQSYVIKANGQTFTIDASGVRDVERDNQDGEVFEWYSTNFGSQERAIVEAILASKEPVTLRYVGRQYRKDRTLTPEEKADLQRVLDAADALRASQ